MDLPDGRTLRALEKLHESIASLAVQLVLKAEEQGIRLTITDGFRTNAEQDALFAQGRTKPGPIVTPLRGGQSLHNYGLAFDVAVLDEADRPTWPNDLALWDRIGAIGEALGLTWGGHFAPPASKDRPHFQFTGGLKMAEIVAGARPSSFPPGVVA